MVKQPWSQLRSINAKAGIQAWRHNSARQSTSFPVRHWNLRNLTLQAWPDNFPNSQRTGEKKPASHDQILASPTSQEAVKSRILSRYLLFSWFLHHILVKSRIPRIPFQTLFLNWNWFVISLMLYGLSKIQQYLLKYLTNIHQSGGKYPPLSPTLRWINNCFYNPSFLSARVRLV